MLEDQRFREVFLVLRHLGFHSRHGSTIHRSKSSCRLRGRFQKR
jgi:hypothetical protein